MKTIALSQGKAALVSDRDYPLLMRGNKWYAYKHRKTFYAWRNIYKKGKGFRQQMHRVILGLTDPNTKADHRDGNGLNNQRHNLRKSTCSQNAMNQSRRSDNTSGVRGVSWQKDRKKWRVEINANRKHIYIGKFSSLKAAKAARVKAEKIHHGKFSALKSRNWRAS